MFELNLSWAWISLVLLGAFHGLNPAMGWLFAVAIGFQERQLRAVVAALGPITLGHALAIGLVAVPVGLLGLMIPQGLLPDADRAGAPRRLRRLQDRHPLPPSALGRDAPAAA